MPVAVEHWLRGQPVVVVRLKVAVLESRIFPRDRPGETLHPGIEPLLETLGVAQQIREANFIRHDGI